MALSIKALNLKTIGIAVGALVALLVLAVVIFFVFFPKDLAAAEAERRIEEATGRDLTLGDDIQITFWPALGFSVNDAMLSNPEDFPSDEAFLAANRIVFAVKVMPLLRGAIEVKELILDGAEVRLRAEDDAAANNNWTFPTENNSQQENTLEDLRLDDVRMIDSMISFQGAEGEPLVLQDVDASLALQSLDLPAQLQAAFDYRNQRINLESNIGLPRAVLEQGETPFSAAVRSDPLQANFEGVFHSATGALTGGVDASGNSLRALMAWIGTPMAAGGGFGPFNVEGQMAHEGQQTALTDATLRLDDINANGSLTLITQESGRLRVNGALSSAAIDLNTYLPPPAQAGQEGVEVDTAWSTSPLDLSGLRALDADLQLNLGSLRFQRMSFADVALALRVANGAADARLTRISMYDGGGTARLIADGSGATPRIAFEIDAQNVQAETLLRDAIGFDKIVGRGRLRASLVGTGTSQAALMRSLHGNASFNFNDGQWKGVNLAQIARTVQSALTGQAAGEGSSTDFAELSATFAVADGVMATNDMRMLNPYVRLEGSGLVNIGAQTIDMRIAPRAVNNAQGQGGDASVAGLGVPFRISGPWSRVSFRPALEEVVQNQLRDILSRQEQGSPLATLGEALFGRTPAATTPPATETPASSDGETPAAETPAQTPAQQEPTRSTNPLEEILRRAREQREQKQTTPAPTP
ncbi:AsmA family protein [Vitreimonas flagellata]|uniref:AsmA family protein n=1 Tax=Vitreimonas flagellata TaxID=2560861 RepID=UPI0010750092|nr:AsmA family protein [Vitreimonas flagellata]